MEKCVISSIKINETYQVFINEDLNKKTLNAMTTII